MAFDQSTRNLLANLVSECRRLLSAEFTAKLQELYGIQPTGEVADVASLTQLTDERREVARLLRERIAHIQAGLTAGGAKTEAAARDAVQRVIREQAFTVLNRLAALRLCEERGLVLECVRQGVNSEGFQLFRQSAGSALGDSHETYVAYLHCLFDDLAQDLGVLFDRFSPMALLFPRRDTLTRVLAELSGTGPTAAREKLGAEIFAQIWQADETIGWIYQYWNDPAERKKMREESSAPRNSRELAVRNQFFTPRYVVEFLTDNTLGRIWYEMTQGETKLKEQCRYLVRRPNEIFLGEVEIAASPLPFDEPLSSIIGDPREAHSRVFLQEDRESYEPPSGWTREAFEGNFENLPAEGDPWTRWVGAAIPPQQITTIIGERWQPMEGNTKLDHLRGSILDGTPDPEARKLPVVWAILSDFCRTNQFAGGYEWPTWQKLWSYFRHLAQSWQRFGPAKESDLSQEDLLKQPVFIPHRPLKDPRTILMLDPACGSMHFGLYAFDLFEVIYDEAWALEEKLGADALSRPPGMKSLHDTYAGKDAFLKDVPRLVIEHNIHGIDIDPRAAQIAGLALWLRAQKAWQRLGLKPGDRPAIKRSNIVCAEPMPGEKELLREFVEREFPAAERAVCLRLLEAIFDKMQLAGEAGSLLKIEEEIRSAIEDARDAWQKLATKPPELFTTTELNQISTAPELTGLEQAVSSLTTDPRHLSTDFWERIEERIYAALRDYAEQAENGGGFQRRLFAEDAARGFAFIDVCRKRYDVALMNPPFGETSAVGKPYLFERYPISKFDLAAAFADRAEQLLTGGGVVGSLTNRSIFYGQMLEDWRRHQFLANGSLLTFGDLGVGVLDAALVEAVAYTFSSSRFDQAAFFFKAVDRIRDILAFVDPLASGRLEADAYLIPVKTFQAIPDFPFAYWTPSKWLNTYNQFRPLESFGFVVRQGMESSDNFRFVRLWWETPSGTTKWKPYSKGGWFGPQWRDMDVVVNWGTDGREVKEFSGSIYGTWTKQITNSDYYGVAGLCYPASRVEFSPRILPRDCIVGCKGPIVALETAQPNSQRTYLALLAVMSSSAFRALVNLTTTSGDTMRKSYRERAVACVPIPEVDRIPPEAVDSVSSAIDLIRVFESSIETCRFFSTAVLSKGRARVADEIRKCRKELDDKICSLYGFTGPSYVAFQQTGYDDLQEGVVSTPDEMQSYLLGLVFGRWDIRYATGEQAAPELPDPFAPLPVCPPGQLQNAQGLPARPEDVPAAYPVRIPWDGILVDDPNHPLDIERRVREVIEIIWSGQEGGPTAEAIEHEACEILGVKSLRDYFRKPAGFFADHLKRYSKSRRQAPIYWPLSTASGSYTLWIYYHRLTDQTLYKCIQQFIDPRLADVEKELAHLRSVLDSGEGSTKTRRQLDDAEQLRTELKEMRAELEHWASRWKPNLNDGVLITASPLWKLFRLPKWRKDLETCWKELEAGDYDWAHLAYTLWPDRVRQKCKTDRSLAIAHGLEELCEVQAPKPKAKRAAKADAAAKEREAKKEELREQLTEALANIFLGQKLPLDITNAQSGEPIIPANRKITKTLLRKLAGVYEHADIAPSPIRDKIREIIAQFEPRFTELEQADQQEMAMEAD